MNYLKKITQANEILFVNDSNYSCKLGLNMVFAGQKYMKNVHAFNVKTPYLYVQVMKWVKIALIFTYFSLNKENL